MNALRGTRAFTLLLSMFVTSCLPGQLSAQVRGKAALSARRSTALSDAGPLLTRQSPARQLGAPSRDRWFGRDKFRHAGSTAAIQIMGIGLLRLAGVSRRASVFGASIVTVGASVAKEIHDAAGSGDLSARDLVWDGVGLALGSGVVHMADPP